MVVFIRLLQAFDRNWGAFFRSPRRAWLYLAVSTPLALLLGLALGGAATPGLQALAFFPLFLGPMMRDDRRAAVRRAVAWAIWTCFLVTGLSSRFPDFAREQILFAGAYQDEMFTWIRTGVGREGDIRLFLPEHALHLASFSVLTLLSAGFLGLVMGAALLNYMSFYVGTLLSYGTKWTLVLIAWPPWAAVRVFAFVLIAVALASWIVRRAGLEAASGGRPWRPLIAGLALAAADVVLKWLLAPSWREWLDQVTALPG